MGFGFWVWGLGFWVLGFGFWVLGSGFWVWVSGFGFWGRTAVGAQHLADGLGLEGVDVGVHLRVEG